MILEVRDLTVWYGSLMALNKVSFNVNKGESVALLGPNGAGKTTALRAIIGVLKDYKGRIKEGEILYKGESIKGLPPYELVRMGICYVPQGRRIFPNLSVKENLEMGGYIIEKFSILKGNLEKVFELFPVLKKRQKQKAATLSGGEQQILAIARALMVNPELLLLDEPLLGLSPNYIKEVMEKVKEIQKTGVSVVIVEHNAKAVLKYVKRIYLFSMGEVILQDSADILTKDGRIHQILGIL
ncbi:ABC transporter ATP-binding protein [Candidatus Aerophobetes bacterium]|mgnify:CR=1 FL=1|uniref:ABC transporter ATP-binding protein n=1 Tax=Aerophobetes bacterium TaxID=2030807 RepID=A0A662DD88_UNCAE|nr:MAG: ABC transporter ATP-binding protein [bacterium]RLE12273.1 MAG: ABC transporter ATP-binding protein [Candidatus Aerophobetes bacterium]